MIHGRTHNQNHTEATSHQHSSSELEALVTGVSSCLSTNYVEVDISLTLVFWKKSLRASFRVTYPAMLKWRMSANAEPANMTA